MKEHGTTKEEVEGPTSSWALRNRITLITLQEHDDDDDDDDDDIIALTVTVQFSIDILIWNTMQDSKWILSSG